MTINWLAFGLGLWLLGQGIAIAPNGARLLPWLWCVAGGVIVIISALLPSA
jgi:hypothetical protein